MKINNLTILNLKVKANFVKNYHFLKIQKTNLFNNQKNIIKITQSKIIISIIIFSQMNFSISMIQILINNKIL
jgi:hypothetical protein